MKRGVLKRPIEAVVRYGASDALPFAEIAQQMITSEGVVTIFGCWTSASRKTILPVLQQYDNLLVYPVQYEGLESSPQVIYTGAAPNQQITALCQFWLLGAICLPSMGVWP